ncbi:MAG TPA: hypothetical protein VGB18_03425 [Candidatus Thermoplasmatota archaeon]
MRQTVVRLLSAILSFVLLAGLFVPIAASQEPVDSCSRQCAPQDTDVNDPPIRSEGPVNVVLYAHMENILSSAPLNVFPPDPEHEPDLNQGFLMPSVAAPDCPTGGACWQLKTNRFNFDFCPGGIEFMDRGWFLQCHSRATGIPLALHTAPIRVYVYVSAHAVPQQRPSESATVGVIPMLNVDARIVDRQLLAADATPLAVSTTGGTRVNVVSLPIDDPVYEIHVDLQPVSLEWPAQTFERIRQVQIDLTQVEVVDGGATQSEWRWHTGARYPPRVVLPIANPIDLRVEYTLREGALYVRGQAHSPLGGYDVNHTSFAIKQIGGPPLPPPRVTKLDYVEPAHHDERADPVEIIWAYNLTSAAGAAYHFEVSVENQQGTYRAVNTTDYALPAFEGEAVPTLAFAMVLATLSVAAFAASTRRRGNA